MTLQSKGAQNSISKLFVVMYPEKIGFLFRLFYHYSRLVLHPVTAMLPLYGTQEHLLA